MEKLDKAPGRRWAILVTYMIPYCFFFMCLNMSVAFSADIQEAMGISATQNSLLMTAAMLSFAFGNTVGGNLQAKIGPKKTNICGIAITIVATLLFAPLGATFAMAIVLRFFQGLGGGIMVTPTLSVSNIWFPVRQRGLANGIVIGILGVGFTLATLGRSAVAGMGLPWNVGAGVLFAAVGVVVLVFFAIAARDLQDVYPGAETVQDMLADNAGDQASGSDDASDAGLPDTMPAARKNPAYLASAIFGFGNAAILYGFGTFLSQLLTVDIGITSGLVTTVIASTFFITIVFTPLGGIVSDQVFKGSRYQTCIIGSVLTGVALVAIALSGSSAALFVAVMLILAYGGNAMPLGPLWAMVPECVSSNIRSKYLGELNTISNFGGILGAPLFAAVMDATGSAYADLWICVAIAVLCVISARIIHR